MLHPRYETPFAKQAAENANKVRERVAETSVGKGVAATRGTLGDAAEDLREQWETSQNPMVYRAQAVFDLALEETERARAIREVQRLDPYFDVEDWLLAIEETTLPDVLRAIKAGDTESLREWLSEGAYAQQYAQIKLLQSSGMVPDPAILDIDTPVIAQIMLQPRDQPVFVIVFQTSQIKCVRDSEGAVVEGDEGALAKVRRALRCCRVRARAAASSLRSAPPFSSARLITSSPPSLRPSLPPSPPRHPTQVSYSACFQQEYDEETTAMVWKVMEIVPIQEETTGF